MFRPEFMRQHSGRKTRFTPQNQPFAPEKLRFAAGWRFTTVSTTQMTDDRRQLIAPAR
jgi:hypothetical protein